LFVLNHLQMPNLHHHPYLHHHLWHHPLSIFYAPPS
jgi:hypothetical protein